MKIATRSFLAFVIEKLNKYTEKERKKKIAAVPRTMSKFGPSGSLKKKNISRERTTAIILRINSDIFFERECIVVIILQNL